MKLEPKGAGGWLLFLVVSLTILTPISGASRTFADLAQQESLYPALAEDPVWTNIKLVTWTFFALQAGLLFAAGYRLSTYYFPSSVRFAIAMLWIGGPTLSLVGMLVIGVVTGADVMAGSDGASSIGGIIGQCLWAGIWTSYLQMSRRVRNTYCKYHLPEDVSRF